MVVTGLASRVSLAPGISSGTLANYIALLNAISTRLIPGISPSLKICLVSQLGDEEELATNPAGAKTNTTSVLDHVLSSYTEREKLLKIKQSKSYTTQIGDLSLIIRSGESSERRLRSSNSS